MTKEEFLALAQQKSLVIQAKAKAMRESVDRTFIHPTAIKPCEGCNALRDLVGLPLITQSQPEEKL